MIPSFVKILSLLTGQRLIFPFYHAISDVPPVHLKHLFNVRSAKLFEQDLDTLLKMYKPVSLQDVVQHLNEGKPLPRWSFHISFDDGLREFGNIAWPILKRKGIPCSLFVNPAFVDNKDMFYRLKASILIDFIANNKNTALINEANRVMGSIISSVANLETFIARVSYKQKATLDHIATYFQIDFNRFLNEQKPYLTFSELQKLHNDGVVLGAHSMDHPLFKAMSEEENLQQITKSVNWVSNNFNPKIKAFSFPFTDFGLKQHFFDGLYAKENKIIDISLGTAGLKKERIKMHLQRIPVEDSTTTIARQLLTQYLYYLAKAPLFKNTIRR